MYIIVIFSGNIASVFISYRDGMEMVKLLDNDLDLTVSITEGVKYTMKNGNLNRLKIDIIIL